MLGALLVTTMQCALRQSSTTHHNPRDARWTMGSRKPMHDDCGFMNICYYLWSSCGNVLLLLFMEIRICLWKCDIIVCVYEHMVIVCSWKYVFVNESRVAEVPGSFLDEEPEGTLSRTRRKTTQQHITKRQEINNKDN